MLISLILKSGTDGCSHDFLYFLHLPILFSGSFVVLRFGNSSALLMHINLHIQIMGANLDIITEAFLDECPQA